MREEFFALDPASTVESIAGIRREILKHFSKIAPGSSLVIDLSRLDRWDTSLGQLLVATKRLAAEKNITLTLDGVEEKTSMEAMLYCDTIREPSAFGGYGDTEAGHE